MLPPFSILRPRSVGEACQMLAEHEGEAAVYAGGTELVLAMKLGLADYAYLVDLKGLPDTTALRVQDGVLVVGSTVTHRRLERSPEVSQALPSLARMEQGIANPRVRTVGTIGGNLAFGEPHSDPAVYLTALEAEFVCRADDESSRVVPAGDLLAGPFESVLEPDELLTEIRIPLPPAGSVVSHERIVLTERPAAIVTTVLRADDGAIAEARIAVGAAGPTPARFAEAENLLCGAGLDLGEPLMFQVGEAVTAAAEIDKDADVDHVRHLVQVLLRRSLRRASAELAAA